MSSPLSLRVLQLAQACVARGVRGGAPGYGRFRGAEVDEYEHWAGLPLEADEKATGHPWCASAVGFLHMAASHGEYNGCPRTGGALHLGDRAPAQCRLTAPQPGAVFVYDRGKGKGHCGIVESLGPLPGQITTCEPDTNAAGSTTGDAWGRHTWSPTNVEHERGGHSVRFFDMGVAP